jgi:integrase
MGLKLYRRHTRNCRARFSIGTRTYESDEGRRDAKKCVCLIHASGTLGTFNRKCTEKFAWADANQVAAAWEKAGSWERINALPITAISEVPPGAAPAPEVITVERAVAAFLAEHEHSASNTQRKYRILMGKLKKYSEEKGYISLARWNNPLDVREFRASWTVGPHSASKDMSTVRTFFDFCVMNEWIERNPAKLVKSPRGRGIIDKRYEQKLPFSDQELEIMYNACETKYGKQQVRWSRLVHHQQIEGEYARYNYKWNGHDLADFISISVYTGLRISDVTTFRIDRMLDTGEIHVRTTKNGQEVNTWVPEWLQERIRARARKFGPLIFGEHTTESMDVITDVWRRKLKKLWSLCEGPDFKWKEKPTPHRFRHTFARILLQRPGVTVRDVAELLGDTEDMVRRHYAAWVPERQERLTAALKAAFAEKPKPKVVEFPKRTGTEA